MKRRSGLLAVLILLSVAACSDGFSPDAAEVTSTAPTTTAPTGEARDGSMCEAFREIAAEDDQFQGKLNGLLAPVLTSTRAGDKAATEAALAEMVATMQGFISSELPTLIDAYDRLAEAAPELAADARVVRDFSAEVGRILADWRGPADEFASVFRSAVQDDGVAAVAAVLRLDQVSRSECDIVLAD